MNENDCWVEYSWYWDYVNEPCWGKIELTNDHYYDNIFEDWFVVYACQGHKDYEGEYEKEAEMVRNAMEKI